MNNTLLDNSDHFRMVKYIKDLLRDQKCTELKIATGYWDLPGTDLIYDELEEFFENRHGKFDLLIGQEPMLRSYMLTEEAASNKFPDFYIQRDVDRLRTSYKRVVELLLKYMDPNDESNSQLRVHVYGQGKEKQFLHAKCYIFLGSGCGFAHGIVGSSNFTQKGLEENAELNYLETDAMRVACPISPYINSKSHLTWFEEKWKNSEPWTGKFIQILKGGISNQPIVPIPIQNIALTPYEVYIRLLQDQFGAIVDDKMDAELMGYLKGTKIMPYDFQIDAVKELYAKMNRMGGFLLADVVGLGKTICGILLVKYYLEHVVDRPKKVLIITPPSMRSSWIGTIDVFNKGNHPTKLIIGDNIDFITSGSIEKLADIELTEAQNDYDNEDDNSSLNIDANIDYSLILIDESHKFRNSNTQMYNNLMSVINGIYDRQGWYPYIGMLSATPQNNRPSDIQNQILLFEHDKKCSHFDRITNKNFEAFFGRINREYANNKSLGTPQAKQQLMLLAKEVREKILESIMVRRTRTDIINNYKSGLVFPEIIGPVKLDYIMDPVLATAFNNTMNAIGRGGTLKYARYRAIEALKDTTPYTSPGMTAKKSADALASIIQILLVKRLESSFDAFRKSLANQKRNIENMLQMIADDQIFICPDLDVNAELDIQAKQAKSTSTVTYATCYNDIRNHISRLTAAGKNTKLRNAEYHTSAFSNINAYEQDLKDDLAIIDALINNWNQVTKDPKLDEFLLQLQNVIMQSDSTRIRAHVAMLNKELNDALKENKTDLAEAIKAEIAHLNEIAQKISEDNEERKLVIFSEAIDTVKRLEAECKKLNYRVLAITAENRADKEDEIRLNFDAQVEDQDRKDDYDIIITTEVLAEGINLHRANAIVNYDSPWNATKLIQRIGRVNRIWSRAAAVFVYNFHPSAQGDQIISLVNNAYKKLQSFHIMFGEDNAVFSDDEQVVSYSIAINGQPSPLQPFIQELRNYKANNAARYDEIANASLEQLKIATAANGPVYQKRQETLCAIKQGETSYILVNDQIQAKVVSTLEAIEACKCDENAVAESLPTNIEQIRQAAMQEYVNYKNRLTPQQSKSKAKTNALNAIRSWQTLVLPTNVADALTSVNIMVRNGNDHIAARVNNLYNDIQAKAISAVPYSQNDIEQAILDIASHISAQKTKIEEPTHFITFCKL